MFYSKYGTTRNRPIEYYSNYINFFIENSHLPIVIYTDCEKYINYKKRKNVFIENKKPEDLNKINFEYKFLYEKIEKIGKSYESLWRDRIYNVIKSPLRVQMFLSKPFLIKDCCEKYSENTIFLDAGFVYSYIYKHRIIKNNLFSKENLLKFDKFTDSIIQNYNHLLTYHVNRTDPKIMWSCVPLDFWQKHKIIPRQITASFFYFNKRSIDVFLDFFCKSYKIFVENKIPVLEEDPFIYTSKFTEINCINISQITNLFYSGKTPDYHDKCVEIYSNKI